MGKSKRTRWRTFELDQRHNSDEDNIKDVPTARGYSRNKNVQKFGRQNLSTNDDFNKRHSHHRLGSQHSACNSWQQKTNQTSIHSPNNVRANNEKEGMKNVKQFNEDEFIRICTPRSDVLFRKGYLSANTSNLAETTIGDDPIHQNASPPFSMSYPQNYGTPLTQYVFYEDARINEGLAIYPVYNYYPSNGSSPTSPVFLMSYPCQYDPVYMPSNDSVECGLIENDEIQNSEMAEDLACENNNDVPLSDDQSENINRNSSNSYEETSLRTRRRKRFPNSRNSKQAQSTDTTSDATSDENNISSQRNPVWKAQRNDVHLNVDVEEFYPRQLEATVHNGGDKRTTKSAEPAPKQKYSAGVEKVFEVNESNASRNSFLCTTEWNVIKNGKQVKIVGDSSSRQYDQNETEERKIINASNELLKTEDLKKSNGNSFLKKSKKPKNKSRRRKSFLGKQEGFEIIEPEFTKKLKADKLRDELSGSIDKHIPESNVSFSHENFINLVQAKEVLAKEEMTEKEIFSIIHSDRKEALAENLQNSELSDLLEDLRMFDEDILQKSLIINKIIDFPITNAITSWLKSKQESESSDLWNMEKVSKLGLGFQYYDVDDVDDDVDNNDGDLTDSDWISSDLSSEIVEISESFDFQTKIKSQTRLDSVSSYKNQEVIPKKLKSESFCALM